MKMLSKPDPSFSLNITNYPQCLGNLDLCPRRDYLDTWAAKFDIFYRRGLDDTMMTPNKTICNQDVVKPGREKSKPDLFRDAGRVCIKNSSQALTLENIL